MTLISICKQLNMQRLVNKQLSLNDIKFDVFPLVFSKNKFDFNRFYSSFVEYDDNFDPELYEPAEKLEEFNLKLRRKILAKRILSRLEMKMSNSNSIGIKVISNIKRLNKPSAVPVDAEESKPLKRVNWHRTGSAGQFVQQEETGKFMEFGGEALPFTDRELKSVRDLVVEGLTIVGFKDKSALKPYHNIQSPMLVLPDDKKVMNSSTTLHALVTEMTNLNRVAIAKVKLLSISSVRMCALLPQTENQGKDGVKTPLGFQMIILPYADDIRKLDTVYPERSCDPAKTDINVAMKLVHNLTIKEFDPRSFENPDVQKFFESLEAMALGDNKTIDTKDFLLPDYEAMERKRAVIEEFSAHFFQMEEESNQNDFETVNTRSKRTRAPKEEKPPKSAKEPKVSEKKEKLKQEKLSKEKLKQEKPKHEKPKSKSKKLKEPSEQSSDHEMEIEEDSGDEEDRIFVEEDDEGDDIKLKSSNRSKSKAKKQTSIKAQSLPKSKSNPQSKSKDSSNGSNMKDNLRKKNKNVHTALIEKIKDGDFKAIRVPELEFYLEDQNILPSYKTSKADKINLVIKHAKIKVDYPN